MAAVGLYICSFFLFRRTYSIFFRDSGSVDVLITPPSPQNVTRGQVTNLPASWSKINKSGLLCNADVQRAAPRMTDWFWTPFFRAVDGVGERMCRRCHVDPAV